jgi:hypothetical protein
MSCDSGCRLTGAGAGAPQITAALIEYHKERAHALRAQAFAAAGRWLVRKIAHAFAGVTQGIDTLPFVNGR